MILLNVDRMKALFQGKTVKVGDVEIQCPLGQDTIAKMLGVKVEGGTFDDTPLPETEPDAEVSTDSVITDDTVDKLRTKADAIEVGTKIDVILTDDMKLEDMKVDLKEGLTRYREQGV